jgi:hypothetical protein
MRFVFSLVFGCIFLICDVAVVGAQQAFCVENTRPPDAFLSLRTHPTAVGGSQIEEMPNGTPLEILQRRPDGWWQVRNVRSGRLGWALSRYGNRIWIDSCRLADASGYPNEAYEPTQGSWERTAILNAVRVRQEQEIKFKVNFLRVWNNSGNSIAYAELEDASATFPLGAFFLETNGGSWRVRVAIGVQGLAACSVVTRTFEDLLQQARRLNAPRTFFSKKFYDDYAEVRTSSSENCAGFDVRSD